MQNSFIRLPLFWPPRSSSCWSTTTAAWLLRAATGCGTPACCSSAGACLHRGRTRSGHRRRRVSRVSAPHYPPRTPQLSPTAPDVGGVAARPAPGPAAVRRLGEPKQVGQLAAVCQAGAAKHGQLVVQQRGGVPVPVSGCRACGRHAAPAPVARARGADADARLVAAKQHQVAVHQRQRGALSWQSTAATANRAGSSALRR